MSDTWDWSGTGSKLSGPSSSASAGGGAAGWDWSGTGSKLGSGTAKAAGSSKVKPSLPIGTSTYDPKTKSFIVGQGVRQAASVTGPAKSGGGFLGDLLAAATLPVHLSVGAGKGLVSMAENAPTEAANVGRMVGGHLSPLGRGDISGALAGVDVPEHLKPLPGESFVDFAQRTAPGVAGPTVGMVSRAGSDIAHPTHFVRDPGQSALDVLGTAALVAGPAARVVGGAAEGAAEGSALARAGQVANLSRTIAERGAAAPMLPLELAGKGLARVAGPVAERLAETGVGQATAELGQRIKARGALESEVRAPELEAKRGAGLNVRAAVKAVGRDPDAQQAVNLVQTGAVPALRGALADTSGATLERLGVTPRAAQLAVGMAEGTLEPKLQVGMEAAAATRLAAVEPRTASYAAGEGSSRIAAAQLRGASPEEAASMRAGLAGSRAEQFGAEPMHPVVREATIEHQGALAEAADNLARERAAAGVPTPDAPDLLNGRVPDPADVARANLIVQRGTSGPARQADYMQAAQEAGVHPASLPEWVAQAKASLGQSDQRGAARVATAQAAHDTAQRNLAEATTKAELSREAAPARYRPAMAAGDRVVRGLHEQAAKLDGEAAGSGDALRQAASEIPTTLKALVDAGVDPAHLIGGRLTETPRVGGGQGGLAVRKLAEERQKLAGTIPRTFAEAARREAQRGAQVVRNEAAPRLVAMFGKTASEVDPELAGLTGEKLAGEMARRDLVAWDPTRLRVGSDEPPRVPSTQVTPQTQFIPKAVARTFDNYWRRGERGHLATFWDSTSRGFKGMNLALSPAVHAAFVVGNLLFQLPAAGAEMVPNMLRAAKLIREEARTGEAKVPARLSGATFSGAERAELEGAAGLRGGGHFGGFRTPYGLAVEKGYGLLDIAERVQRVAVYLSKKGEGLSDEAALRESLKIAGDFQRLTPFEQNVIKRIFPGYSWTRHMTQLAYRLPFEHPLRVAWLLNVARSDPNTGKLPWWLNPFESALQVGQLHPLLRLGLAGLLGESFTRGTVRPITHAPGEAGTSTSRPIAGLAVKEPGALAHIAGRMVPVGRLAEALTQTPVARYETGARKVTARGLIPLQGGRGAEALRALGVTSQPPPSPRLAAAIQRAQTADQRAALRYKARLARAGG